MKIVILNDLHFGVRNANHVFLAQAEGVIDQVISRLDEGDQVFILGDVFDSRNAIPLTVMDVAHRCFDKLRDWKVTILLGNHDIHYVNTLTPNSIQPLLSEFDNIDIVDEPKQVTFGQSKILLVPWICPKDTVEWTRIIKKSPADICMGHFDIQGFRFNSRTVNTNHGFKMSIFSHFENVISGHYHYGSKEGNIEFPGAQYQMTWDDYGDQKVFLELDETGTFTRVNSGSDVFKIIDMGSPTDGLSGCYVRLMVGAEATPSQVKEKLEEIVSAGSHEVKTVQDFQSQINSSTDDVAKTIANAASIDMVIGDVVEDVEVEDGVDKERLISLVKEISKEAWVTMGEG